MHDLNTNNVFKMTQEETKSYKNILVLLFSNDSFGNNTIKEFLNNGYLMDPHTATCIKTYNELKRNL